MAIISGGSLALSGVSALHNVATAGDGGALCYAPATQPQICGFSGKAVRLQAPTGDVSVVAPGSPVPITQPFNCSWQISFSDAGCAASLAFSAIFQDVLYPWASSVAVTDLATGGVLFSTQGAPPALPPPLVSSSSAGLQLDYAWDGYGDTPWTDYTTGLLASWQMLCSLPGGGYLAGNAAGLSLAGLVALNNSAAGDGGALALALDPGFSGVRRSLVSLLGGVVSGNSAGGDGGGVAASGAGMLLSLQGTAVRGSLLFCPPLSRLTLLPPSVEAYSVASPAEAGQRQRSCGRRRRRRGCPGRGGCQRGRRLGARG